MLNSRVLAVSLSLVFLLGCARLDPYQGRESTTPPPVEEGIWAEIEKVQKADWQVPLNVGEEALEWRLRAIDSATSSIDLQSFIWTFDTVGNALQERLLAAADRGVNVRILIDDSFLAGKDRHLVELNDHQNVQYRVYNPYKRRSSGAASRFVLNLGDFQRLDHRMHNKSMVVDNQVAIVGGRNLADEYFGFAQDENFRDMELLVGGPIVEEISQSFDQYWNDRWSFPIDEISGVEAGSLDSATAKISGVKPIFPPELRGERDAKWMTLVRDAHRGRARLIVDSPPEDRPEAIADRPTQVADEIARLIRGARKDITIVSAYLIPSPRLIEGLKDAVGRGVRVRLLTNSINSNNHITAYSAYRTHTEELLNLGAEVHEVRTFADSRKWYILPPISQKNLGLHAKYMILDSRKVVVGSANLDPRSLRINTEMGLVVDSPSLARELLALTEPDFDTTNSWRLSLEDDGSVIWVGDDIILDAEPAQHAFQRLEEWFFAHLPIEDEM